MADVRYVSEQERARNIYEAYTSRTKITSDGDLVMGDLPSIWVRREVIYNMWKELSRALGARASSKLMYNMGRPHGKASIENVKAFLNIETIDPLAEDQLLEFLCAENMVMGWGAITIRVEAGNITVVNLKGFPVGREAVIKKDTPTDTSVKLDAYYLGYFDGFFTELYNTKFRSEETECVATGGRVCRLMFRRELTPKTKPAKVKTKVYDADEVIKLAKQMRRKLEITLPPKLTYES